MDNLDILSTILVIIFLVPIIYAVCVKFKLKIISGSFNGLINIIEILISFVLAVFISKKTFFDNSEGFFKMFYGVVPQIFKDMAESNQIFISIVFIPLVFMIILAVFLLIMIPINKYVITRFTDFLDKKYAEKNDGIKKIIAAIIEIPRALCYVIIVVLFLNSFSSFFYNSLLSNAMKKSSVYKILYNSTVESIVNIGNANNLPILYNDFFKGTGLDNIVDGGNKTVLIEYFNGITLDEAVKSNPEIDKKAVEITLTSASDSAKAYAIYNWITQNMEYDEFKAQKVNDKTIGFKSGSIEAFNTKKGICFDFSSLYVTMCLAIGLKVRLITGQGFNGTVWGDHAWNEVYSSEEKRWLNVDVTFGQVMNYFDNANFNNDHAARDMQRQW